MANMNQDPVCKMEVNPQTAAGRSQYEGQTYHFCSQECKQKFDRNPEQYAKQKGQSAGRFS